MMGWAVGLMLVCGFLVALAVVACAPKPEWLKRLNAMEKGRERQAR